MDRIQRGRAMPIHPRLNDKWLREATPPTKMHLPGFFLPRNINEVVIEAHTYTLNKQKQVI